MSFNWSSVQGTVNVVLQSLPVQRSPFTLAVHVADGTTVTDPYKVYTSVDGIDADTELSSAAKAALTAMIAPASDYKPASVALLPMDTTYVAALQTAIDAGLDFGYVTADTRSAAIQVLLSDWCEARQYIYLTQSGDASWLNAGVPSGYTGIVGNKQTGIVYHPTDAQWADAEWAGFVSAKDPDVARTNFRGPIGNATTYLLTESEAAAAIANKINIIGPDVRGDTTVYIGNDAGAACSLEGELLYGALTKLWTTIKIEDSNATILQQYDELSEGVPFNDAGAQVFLAPLTALGELGLRAGHYTKSAALPKGYAFTYTLDATRTVNITARYGFLDTIAVVNVTAYLSRS